ncbi:phage tail protein [Skermanella mucosa]|uniref:TipJ family phage tail tip protein n=1 Tax=Skermanella mucosa TaxID=1789672 RepID=UPI00192C307A|nr:phage tail protein [Skermanella mucosa]UEM18981.1 phage tail protein [Skermanella mucosa]
MNDFNEEHWLDGNGTPYVYGAGGGGKGGSSRTPVEEANTLQSNSIARVLFAVSEGEIGGLRRGRKSVFLNETALEAEDGTQNFEGVTVQEVTGLPDQAYIPGFAQAESLIQVNTEVVKASPFIRANTSPDIDSVRVIIGLPALLKVDVSTGDQRGTTVEYALAVRDTALGVWEDRGNKTVTGKCTSPTELAYLVERPSVGTGQWEVRVTRITDDSASTTLSNKTFVSSIVEITDFKSNYPDTACIALTFDLSKFGNSLPSVAFDLVGIKIPVPVNYDPDTGIYSGPWTGEFRNLPCSNPAWHLLNLIREDRYGLGIPAQYINVWEWYQIAKYCDELVPDGKGGQRRRFTLRYQINSTQDALQWIRTIASTMNALPYWGSGVVHVAQDRPKTPVMLVNSANVRDGLFTYASTEFRERITYCACTYSSESNFWKPEVAIYEASAADITRYGRNEEHILKVGCVSESEALALAKYVVETSLREYETVSYHAGADHTHVRPGDVVKISDPLFTASRVAGRVASATANTVTFDAGVLLNPGESYSISILETVTEQAENGQNVTYRKVVSRTVTTPGGSEPVTTVTVTPPYTAPPTSDQLFIVSGSDIQPRPFRVLSMKEGANNVGWEVNALFVDETKYPELDLGIDLEPPIFSRIRDDVPEQVGPLEFQIVPVMDAVTGPSNNLVVKWARSPSKMVFTYRVMHRVNNGQYKTIGTTPVPEFVLERAGVGVHDFIVYAISLTGKESHPRSGTYEFSYGGSTPADLSAPTSIFVTGTSGQIFQTQDCPLSWTENPANAANGFVTAAWQITIKDFATDAILRTATTPAKELNWTYLYAMNRADGGGTPLRKFKVEVRAVDAVNRLSAPATATIENPAPPLPTGVSFTEFFQFYRLQHDPSTDPQAIGTLIWASDTAGFTPGPSNLVYRGAGTMHDVPSAQNKTWRIRFAVMDDFSETGLNVSSEYVLTTLNSDVTVDDPAAPVLNSVTSASEIARDGTERVTVTANFTPAADKPHDKFELGIRESQQGIERWYTGLQSPITVEYKANQLIIARVRAYNLSIPSDWSNEISITTARDTTPPAVPANFAASAGYKTIILTWDRHTEIDFSHVEIYESTTTTAPTTGTTPTFRTDGSVFAREGLTAAGTRYFWARAVDRSNNKSAWTARVSAEAIVSINVTDFASGIAPVEIVSTLPTTGNTEGRMVYLTSDKKLYRFNGSSFTAGVGTGDLVGTISANQIAANSITAGQIATGAIAADEIATGAITTDKIGANQVIAEKIATGAVTADKILANAVTAVKIDANAVTTDKIAAGAITAAKIKTGEITADHIQAGAITARSLTISNTDNLNPDPEFRDPAFWNPNSLSGASYFDTNTAWPVRRAIRINGQGAMRDYHSEMFSLPTGGKYRISGWVVSNISGTGRASVYLHQPLYQWNAMGQAGLGTFSETGNQIHYNSGNNGGPKYFSLTFENPTGQNSNANKEAQFRISANMPSGSYIEIGGLEIVRASDETLITEDAITTGKIRANAITSEKVLAGAITAGKLAANSVVADNIQAGAITTGKIGANQINGAHIVGGSITGGHIVGNTINGAHIIGGSITGGHIQAQTIDANVIKSSNITTNLVTTGGSIQVWDSNNSRTRVHIGHISGHDFGMRMWAPNGSLIFDLVSGDFNGAYIKDLSVGTLKVAGGAITNQVGVQGNNTLWITKQTAGPVLVIAQGNVYAGNTQSIGGHDGQINYIPGPGSVSLYRHQTFLKTVSGYFHGSNSLTVVYYDQNAGAAGSAQAYVLHGPAASGCTLYAVEFKR